MLYVGFTPVCKLCVQNACNNVHKANVDVVSFSFDHLCVDGLTFFFRNSSVIEVSKFERALWAWKFEII